MAHANAEAERMKGILRNQVGNPTLEAEYILHAADVEPMALYVRHTQPGPCKHPVEHDNVTGFAGLHISRFTLPTGRNVYMVTGYTVSAFETCGFTTTMSESEFHNDIATKWEG